LERRLKQRGYFRCTACQKPYLTRDIFGQWHIYSGIRSG
jgi:hypothetical protein